jgi:hypothetical protein
MRASHFTSFDHAALESLRILPPLESKDKSITWARGSIRDGQFNEFLVTGPRLPVLFSGCRFNNVVFSMHGPKDSESYAFEVFLHNVLSVVERAVCASPDKFKPGVKNAALLHFDRDFIRPSSYSPDLPNEMRVKLSVKRNEIGDNGEVIDMIESVFVDEHGQLVNPGDITAGSEIIPIIRISYYRNGNKFGLNLTLLKGMVYPGEPRVAKSVDHAALEFDLGV